MGTRSLPGVKRLGREVNHPPPSSTEVKKGKKVKQFQYRPGQAQRVPGS